MYLALIAYTLLAWLIHGALVSFYGKFFDSTSSIAFRATHALEIFLTVVVAIIIYRATVNLPVSAIAAILTVLAVMVVLDGASLAIFESLRQKFDAWHFLAAYATAIVAIIAAYKRFF